MNRRELLRSSLGAAAAMAVQGISFRLAAAPASRRIKIGMVGTSHAHASGKLATVRKLADWFDLVGVVEPDEQRRQKLSDQKDYAGVRWTTPEQLLNHAGLDALLIETA